MVYRIREVDPFDDKDAYEELRSLHSLTFFASAPQPDLYVGHWWLVRDEDTKQHVAFAGLVPASYDPRMGYFTRVGVLHVARGHKLQKRLLSVAARRARRNGWVSIISDTTDNPPSANAMISAGYKIFEPAFRWSVSHTTSTGRSDLMKKVLFVACLLDASCPLHLRQGHARARSTRANEGDPADTAE